MKTKPPAVTAECGFERLCAQSESEKRQRRRLFNPEETPSGKSQAGLMPKHISEEAHMGTGSHSDSGDTGAQHWVHSATQLISPRRDAVLIIINLMATTADDASRKRCSDSINQHHPVSRPLIGLQKSAHGETTETSCPSSPALCCVIDVCHTCYAFLT